MYIGPRLKTTKNIQEIPILKYAVLEKLSTGKWV